MTTTTAPAQARPTRFGGFAYGWEVGLLLVMAALYLAGTQVNPRFFGDLTALHSVLRDASRFGVMAVGMTFVIVNKDLDLSVGSTTAIRSEEHTSELQSLMRISYAVFCLNKKKTTTRN